MFGVVFKTFDGKYEMALKKLFTRHDAAEVAMVELIKDFGPSLATRYKVVEVYVI